MFVLKKKLAVMLLVLIALSVFTFSNGASAHASTLSSHVQPEHLAGGMPTWITTANPYIHIAGDQATVDPALYHVLSATDMAKVEQAVQHYSGLSASPLTVVHPYAGCNPGYGVSEWWGTLLHLTPCGVALVTAGVALIALFGPEAAAAAAITIAEIQAAAALSCDGSVNILEPSTGGFVAVPAC